MGASDGIVELMDGIVRLTWALPLGIDHVHCYLLRARDDSWALVDTGLGLDGAEERWQSVLERLDVGVGRIVITHFHPDHVGAASIVAGVTGAPVFQGAIDYAQCVRAWGVGRAPDRFAAYMRDHGMPAAEIGSLREESDRLARMVAFSADPEPLEPGEDVDGWEVLHLPGHADGHLCLLRDGVLIAGDALLATISPNVGLYPDSREDPLADYLSSLARIVELAPRVAFAGHGETIEDPPRRARELIDHHARRLESTLAALRGAPRTAYEVSLELFPEPLPAQLRRFALAESRAHLEHLARRGPVERSEADGLMRYAAV